MRPLDRGAAAEVRWLTSMEQALAAAVLLCVFWTA